MKQMSTFNWIVFLLVVIGAINWGLVGLMGYDVVASLAGAGTTVAKAVYTLIGLAGVVKLVDAVKG